MQTHPAYPRLKQMSHEQNTTVYDVLNNFLADLSSQQNIDVSKLTRSVHVYPDFHGNRSPLADSQMTGAICGLRFDSSLENLAVLYLACIQSLAYQTRHIVQVMNTHECKFRVLTIIGGLATNKLYCQLQSDITGLPVLVCNEKSDSVVLLGSAILGASNSNEFGRVSFDELLKRFGQSTAVHLVTPSEKLKSYHEAKYKIYLKMIDDQLYYRNLMQEV